MITEDQSTGVIVAPGAKVLDVRKAIDDALAKTLPTGKTKALVGVGRFENGRFVGEVAWVQKVNNNWSVTAGLSAGTAKPVSGQVMVAGAW